MYTRIIFLLLFLLTIRINVSAQGNTHYGSLTSGSGVQNSFFGYFTGYNTTQGRDNAFFGYHVGRYNTVGSNNSFFGSTAGKFTTTGNGNSFFGFETGLYNTTGIYNTVMGALAGRAITAAVGNTVVGYQAGYKNQTGYRNVFLGYAAGYNELGHNKLYIENGTKSEPLIYGDFGTRRLAINTKAWPDQTATLVVRTHTLSGPGGMYLDAAGENAQPYYGYATGGVSRARSYYYSQMGQLRFRIGLVDRFIIDDNGWVGIGTTNSSSEYKLSVNGKVRAKSITVETNWADFVFADDYQLRPLSEVASYIRQHKHLPDVPSGAQITQQGVDLGPMQATLLQKIEELTLYLLQANEETNQLRKEMEILKAAVNN